MKTAMVDSTFGGPETKLKHVIFLTIVAESKNIVSATLSAHLSVLVGGCHNVVRAQGS